MSITEMSMALAIGQLMWGMFQPLFGAWADKRGPLPVLLTGALLLCLGQICTLQAGSFWSMTLAQGVLSPAGAAAGSFSILIGIVAGRLPEDKRSGWPAASSMPEAFWGSLPLRPWCRPPSALKAILAGCYFWRFLRWHPLYHHGCFAVRRVWRGLLTAHLQPGRPMPPQALPIGRAVRVSSRS